MKKFTLVLLAILLVGVQFGYAKKSQRSDTDLRQAENLFAQNDLDGAFNCVNKFLADYPKTSDGYFLRAKIYRKQGERSEALVNLNRALEYITKEDEVQKCIIYWWRGVVYDEMGNYDAAIADYTAAYKLMKKQDNNHVSRILMNRAEAYAAKQDYKKEIDSYFLMLKYNEKDQMAMAGIARLFLRNGQYEKVVNISNHSEAVNPSYAGIYLFRMQAYNKLGNKTAAIDDAVKYLCTADSPNMSIVYEILEQQPRYALACVSELCQIDKTNVDWKMVQIELYKKNFDYVSAIKKYNDLEREYGPSIYVYKGKSECYNEIGYSEYAIDYITACIEVAGKEELFELLYQRVDCYFSAGLYDEAIADLDILIEMQPKVVQLYEIRGWCYQLKGNYNAAMKDFNMGVDVDPSNASIRVRRGVLYLRLKKNEDAKRDFERVLQMDTEPRSGSVRHYALLFTGARNDALDWANKIIATQPQNAGLYYDKACLLSLMKGTTAAIDALRIAFENGYRTFAHIENDDDLDYIRNNKDFIALVNEYKAKPIEVNDYIETKPINDNIPDSFEIPMTKSDGGTYEVACQINGVPMKLIFDTGAASVTISLSEAMFMLKNGYLTDADIKGKVYHSVASGEVVEGTRILLKEIRIGEAVLRDVEASVVHNQEAPLLLGQTVLERFGTVTIDNANSKIIIRK